MEKKFYILFFLVVSFISEAQLTNQEIKAKIDIEENADVISISGMAENLTDSYKSLSYKLSVIKNEKGNKSNNTQSGRFTLENNQIKTLSKTQVNPSKSEIIVLLLIYDENEKFVAKDRVVIGSKEVGEYSNEKVKGDGIEISGIVSDETKTKLGKDFYDFFYREYSSLKIKSTKVVVVEEELTNSRTTRIKVKIDGEIINELISRPDEDYLKAWAEDSVAKTFNYFKNQEKQKKYITQY